MSDTQFLKRVAQQIQQQRAQMEETTPDIILQNLMIDDPFLKQILKGEIQEQLYQLQDIIIECSTHQQIDIEHAGKILEVLKTMNSKLARYQRLKPFLMMLSPLVGLTNFSQEQADQMKRRVGIQISRQIVNIDEEELEADSINFWESLESLIWIKLQDSVEGWKPRIVTEQKKVIETTFTEPKKKGVFGRFF